MKRINVQVLFKVSGIFLACLLVFQCQTNQKSTLQKNVLFIIVDDLRPQMGCYEKSLPLHGQSLMKTPNIDEMAAEGVLFERAYCAIPVCGASRLSILTGSRPYKEPGKPWDVIGRIIPGLTMKHDQNRLESIIRVKV